MHLVSSSLGTSSLFFFLPVSTKYVVTKKILFVDVILKVEMKSVSVLLVIEQSSDTNYSQHACLIHTGACETGREVLA